jgi:hypothetical protein
VPAAAASQAAAQVKGEHAGREACMMHEARSIEIESLAEPSGSSDPAYERTVSDRPHTAHGRSQSFRWGQFCCVLIDPASPHSSVAWTVRCVEQLGRKPLGHQHGENRPFGGSNSASVHFGGSNSACVHFRGSAGYDLSGSG